MKFEFQFKNNDGGDYVSCTSRNMKSLTQLLKPQQFTGESQLVEMRVILKEIPEGFYVDNVGLYLTSSSSFGEYQIIQSNDDPNESLNLLRSFEVNKGLFVVHLDGTKEAFTNNAGVNEASKINIITNAQLANDGFVDFQLQFCQSSHASNARLYVGLEAAGRLVGS
jgi:hypothetical protein